LTERSPSHPDPGFDELRVERLELPDGRYLLLYEWAPHGPMAASPRLTAGTRQPSDETGADV
jgi:hypothetical protein